MTLGFPRYPEGMIENSPMLQPWVRDWKWARVPKGTAEHWLRVISRSFGTLPVRTINPTLKRWAIVTISLREKGFALLGRPKVLVALTEDGARPGTRTRRSGAFFNTLLVRQLGGPPLRYGRTSTCTDEGLSAL